MGVQDFLNVSPTLPIPKDQNYFSICKLFESYLVTSKSFKK